MPAVVGHAPLIWHHSELLTLLDLGRGVIDVAQIGIESNPLLSIETYGSKHNDGSDEPRMFFEAMRIETLESPKSLARTTVALGVEEVGQEDEAEECGASQRERSEETEIAQEL